MKLSDFLEDLKNGELRKINFGDNSEPGLTSYNYGQVIAYLNKAIYDIYIRFPVKIEEIIIQQSDHIQLYYLRPEFAETNTASNQPTKYLKDSPSSPFDSRIIKILNVYNEDGKEFDINDENSNFSVFTPEPDVIQIMQPSSLNAMSVIYKPEPKRIFADAEDFGNQEIQLPRFFEQALEYFIIAKVIASREYVDEQNEEMLYWQKYEKQLAYVVQQDLHMADNMTNIKLNYNGWV